MDPEPEDHVKLPNVEVTEETPNFAHLFPLCAAVSFSHFQLLRFSNFYLLVSHSVSFLDSMTKVIHHGGAGTTQTALNAGVPQAILPVLGDQVLTAIPARDTSIFSFLMANEFIPWALDQRQFPAPCLWLSRVYIFDVCASFALYVL